MQQEGEFIASGQPTMTPMQPAVPVAEKPKKAKSGKVTKTLCIIFALATAGLGGYVAYDRISEQNDIPKAAREENSEQTESEAVSSGGEAKAEEPKAAKQRMGFVRENYGMAYYVTAAGDVYLEMRQVQQSDTWIDWKISNPDTIGAAGVYMLNKDELDFHPWSDDMENPVFEVEGIKLDLNNIVYVSDMVGCGQQVSEIKTYLVDTDGVASILRVNAPYASATTQSATLEKNIEKNVAAIMETNLGDAVGSVLVYRDGSQKSLCEE